MMTLDNYDMDCNDTFVFMCFDDIQKKPHQVKERIL
jgi:hypothetical protein